MDGLSDPKTKRGRLQRAVLACLRAHEDEDELPTNGQFIWYELVNQGIVPKHKEVTTGRTPKQDVADALLRVREVGLVPWDWIVDETCTLSRWDYAASVADFVLDAVGYARIDVWQGAKPPVLLTESRSLSGVLEAHMYEYLVPIAPTGGQTHGMLVTKIAPLLSEGDRVLYLGDWDHQGSQIEANTRRILENIVGPLDWRRVAITKQQVKKEWVIVKADRRYDPVRYHEACETEALGQKRIVQLVREALDALLPEPLETVRVREQHQRFAMTELLRHEAQRRP